MSERQEEMIMFNTPPPVEELQRAFGIEPTAPDRAEDALRGTRVADRADAYVNGSGGMPDPISGGVKPNRNASRPALNQAPVGFDRMGGDFRVTIANIMDQISSRPGMPIGSINIGTSESSRVVLQDALRQLQNSDPNAVVSFNSPYEAHNALANLWVTGVPVRSDCSVSVSQLLQAMSAGPGYQINTPSHPTNVAMVRNARMAAQNWSKR